MVQAKMTSLHYDQFGKTYAQTRQADPRIAGEVISLLDLLAGSTVADIGAGTGNYSRVPAEQGFRALAVEPSAVFGGLWHLLPDLRTWLWAQASFNLVTASEGHGSVSIIRR